MQMMMCPRDHRWNSLSTTCPICEDKGGPVEPRKGEPDNERRAREQRERSDH
jgi:hypothetical protein